MRWATLANLSAEGVASPWCIDAERISTPIDTRSTKLTDTNIFLTELGHIQIMALAVSRCRTQGSWGYWESCSCRSPGSSRNQCFRCLRLSFCTTPTWSSILPQPCTLVSYPLPTSAQTEFPSSCPCLQRFGQCCHSCRPLAED